MKEHVAQNIQGLVQVTVKAPGVEAGVLLGGIGVDLTANGVHVSGQLGSGPAGCPFEQHMLNEVGGPILHSRFVSGASADKKAQGRRPRAGHPL